jgi:hypothetical protein
VKYAIATIALLFSVSALAAHPVKNTGKNAPKHSIVKKHKKLDVVHGKV